MPDSTTNDLERLEGLREKMPQQHITPELFHKLLAENDGLRSLLDRNEAALVEARAERDQLRAAINQTLSENGHLADGDNCTLIHLKRSIAELEVGR